MKRREFITLLGGTAATWPLAPRAQQPKWGRVGWLSIAQHPFIEGFRRGMLELGWREGENFEIEQQYADGHSEKLIDLAAALGRTHNDVIVASGSDAVDAAGKAIFSIPIVGVASTVGRGGNLARPQANMTGIALLYDEIAAKWPELLREIYPRATAVVSTASSCFWLLADRSRITWHKADITTVHYGLNSGVAFDT